HMSLIERPSSLTTDAVELLIAIQIPTQQGKAPEGILGYRSFGYIRYFSPYLTISTSGTG
ncbi:hypothetical protein MKX03_020628, partial [Papaver bracteatum]